MIELADVLFLEIAIRYGLCKYYLSIRFIKVFPLSGTNVNRSVLEAGLESGDAAV